jgi:hypothetical protein
LDALATIDVLEAPCEAVVNARCTQANAPIFLPSNAVWVDTKSMEACMIPLMWALCFLTGGSPKENRNVFECIRGWGRCACVAAGPIGAKVNQSSTSTEWRDFPCGSEYNEWAQGWFRAGCCTVQRQPAPATAPPVDQHSRMAKAAGVGMKGATAAKKDQKEKFATHGKLKILAACGLHKGECPLVCDKTTEDSRTRSAVHDGMEQEHRTTTVVVEFPSSVFLLTQLVSDVKDLKFGWQGSNAFESCHDSELLPFFFLVPHSSNSEPWRRTPSRPQ